jgi:hypothetical protein
MLLKFIQNVDVGALVCYTLGVAHSLTILTNILGLPNMHLLMIVIFRSQGLHTTIIPQPFLSTSKSSDIITKPDKKLLTDNRFLKEMEKR